MKPLPPGVTIYAGGRRFAGEAPEELHPTSPAAAPPPVVKAPRKRKGKK